MLFNSIEFAIFLPIVFGLYWFIAGRNVRIQNLLIVAASYLFYGWWDWRFLCLILLSTVIDYTVGRLLAATESPSKRSCLLWASLIANLGTLAVFKYYNFFVDSLVSGFSLLGTELSPFTLKLILPVGISFYTFQTMSYTIDVYRRKIDATRDFIAFTAFVSYFPQLVAGPIERASHLLPQFSRKRVFNYEAAVQGVNQILWGLVKKVVIADNCAVFANLIFNNSDDYSGSTLLLGAFFFAFQIYGDFSGYSDIAIGVSKLFGIELMQNFAFPYFSRDIGEFWRRWHISLSTWFRDYVYIPLGGSRGSLGITVRNTMIVFIVSGFWHGANWTFLAWGLLNALLFLPLMISKRHRTHLDGVAEGRLLPTFLEVFQIMRTFLLVTLTWVFFRAENISHALSYLGEIFAIHRWDWPSLNSAHNPKETLVLLGAFIVVEWIGRHDQFATEFLGRVENVVMRRAAYYGLCFSLLMFGSFEENQFIYFQF